MVHTRLLVCRRLSAWLLIVVRDLVLHWWDRPAIHSPRFVALTSSRD